MSFDSAFFTTKVCYRPFLLDFTAGVFFFCFDVCLFERNNIFYVSSYFMLPDNVDGEFSSEKKPQKNTLFFYQEIFVELQNLRCVNYPKNIVPKGAA